jgi:hypothetical protein
MSSTRYSCQILMKLELSRQIFEKYSNSTFHETHFSASRVVPGGREGIANSLFSQFFEHA